MIPGRDLFYNFNRIHFDLTSPADGRGGIGNDNAAASAGGVTEQKVRILSGITILNLTFPLETEPEPDTGSVSKRTPKCICSIGKKYLLK